MTCPAPEDLPFILASLLKKATSDLTSADYSEAQYIDIGPCTADDEGNRIYTVLYRGRLYEVTVEPTIDDECL